MPHLFENPTLNCLLVPIVCSSLDQHDICSVARVNRHFYHLLTPSLYRKITISESHKDPQSCSTCVRTTWTCSALHNCKKLVRTLVESPHLARLIEQIEISEDVWFKDVLSELVNTVSSTGNSLQCVRCLHEWPIWNCNTDKFCYRCGDIDREALLVCNRANSRLESVQCQGHSGFRRLVEAAPSRKFLKRLKEVEIAETKFCNPKLGVSTTARGVTRIVRRLRVLYEPYWFIMNEIDLCEALGHYQLRELSLDRTIAHGSKIVADFDNYIERELELVRRSPLLGKVRYRFLFESVGFFSRYFVLFLEPLRGRDQVSLELIIAIKCLDASRHEQVVGYCYEKLEALKVREFGLTVVVDGMAVEGVKEM